MADFDEVLLSLPGVTNFTVTIIKNKPVTVKLVVEVLPGRLLPDKSQIYQAVRQLPVIREAETQGSLVLASAVTRKLPAVPGKRCIQVTDTTEGAERHAR